MEHPVAIGKRFLEVAAKQASHIALETETATLSYAELAAALDYELLTEQVHDPIN